MGARSHHLIVEYLDQLQGSIVEIGAGRCEGSTDFFAGIAACRPDLQYHSVDFDPEAHKVMGKYALKISNMHAHLMRGEDFLANILVPSGERVCWAYLDNFDWIYYAPDDMPPWVQKQIMRYASFDLIMNNENSQAAHLEQTKLIASIAAERCVIHFDDTRLVPAYENIPRHFDGKGGTAVPWLVSQGWRVLYGDNSNIACANFE
jgi:hypothetical protein